MINTNNTKDTDFGFHFDHSYLGLPSCFYQQIHPEQMSQPELVILNHALANDLGLNFSQSNPSYIASVLSGNHLLKDGAYFAQAYAGHQYGHFTMLGDGRALMLGEHVTRQGQRFDLQCKGSGKTAYSRSGDGRATLGPMLREYIISEAMHHLGIPTTRSLAVITTGEMVQRDIKLPGAILTRVAPSHIRIGTFEFAANFTNKKDLKALLDYTIDRHYPHLRSETNPALAFLQAVMTKQAQLVVQWMRVGFIHGVMNTDNISIAGDTIDYGPCALMDTYDPKTVFSSIDRMGRYAYHNQLPIMQWNLAKLAETLLPCLDDNPHQAIALAQHEIDQFPILYQKLWLDMMRAKLGLISEEDDDFTLINELLDWMHCNHADFTHTFCDLSYEKLDAHPNYQAADFQAWYRQWLTRLARNQQSLDTAYQLMKTMNPVIIPRNHQVEHVLQAAHAHHLDPLHQLLDALSNPYTRDARFESYRIPPTPEQRIQQTFCGT